MELKCILLLVLLTFPGVFGVPGDPVMYLPPFEVRTLDSNRVPVAFPFSSSQFQPMSQNQMPLQLDLMQEFQEPMMPEDQDQEPSEPQLQHKIFHKSDATLPGPMTEQSHETDHNSTLNRFVEALNQFSEHEGDKQMAEPPRSANEYHDEYPSASSSYTHAAHAPTYLRPYLPPYAPPPLDYTHSPYSYLRPPGFGFGYPSYHRPATSYAPVQVHHSSAKTLKPFAGFLEPVATKAASKVGGLLSLVLSLLGSGSGGGAGLTGFKDILINGIVKPLLIAKGGIKMLISKLTIPVISLLLINLEVLITVWWLWDDCPEVHPAPVPVPVYHYPKPAYGHHPRY